MSQLLSDLRQNKPFESLQEELWLSLARTTALASHEVELRLREYKISPTQYNVLRILRGAGADGLMQHEVGARLVALVPDVPRILTRMEKAGLVLRVRGKLDRRVMRITLSPAGQSLVDGLDETMRRLHEELFAGMEAREMRSLCDLLELARCGAGTRVG
jgi:DNA-binding MarR family transcriptional regulator